MRSSPDLGGGRPVQCSLSQRRPEPGDVGMVRQRGGDGSPREGAVPTETVATYGTDLASIQAAAFGGVCRVGASHGARTAYEVGSAYWATWVKRGSQKGA